MNIASSAGSALRPATQRLYLQDSTGAWAGSTQTCRQGEYVCQTTNPTGDRAGMSQQENPLKENFYKDICLRSRTFIFTRCYQKQYCDNRSTTRSSKPSVPLSILQLLCR